MQSETLASLSSIASMLSDVKLDVNWLTLLKLVKTDPDAWAVELGTSGFVSFDEGLEFLALLPCDFTTGSVKALLAEHRSEGQASLYRRFTVHGQRVFFPPNRARGGDAPFDSEKGDLTTKFIPTCYNCPGEPATFRMLPCKCNCICHRCATEIKLGSWTSCPVCGSLSKGSVKHL